MRIDCPLCGPRDRREFYYKGAATLLDRPAEGETDAMHRYLHLRENPAGFGAELWYHEAGCAAWLVVTRNMTTHQIRSVTLAHAGNAHAT